MAKRSLLISVVVGLLCAEASFAKEEKQMMQSTRFLGRGNTYVAAMNGDDATRGNVASLGDPTKVAFQLRWTQAEVNIGENAVATINDIVSLATSSSFEASSFLQLFDGKFGKRQAFRVQFAPLAMRIYNFEVMPFYSTSAWLDMRSPALPAFGWEVDTVLGMNYAYGFELGNGLQAGVGVKHFGRSYIGGSLGFANIMSLISGDISLSDYTPKWGSGVALDLGLIWSPSKETRYGLNIENFGDASYFEAYGTEPPAYLQKINIGGMWRFVYGGWNLDTYAEIHDLVNREEMDYMRLFHFGAEFGTSYFTEDHDLGLTLGLNEGYVSSGFFMDLWLARIFVSNYAVETGESPGQRPDRRWSIGLSSSMSF